MAFESDYVERLKYQEVQYQYRIEMQRAQDLKTVYERENARLAHQSEQFKQVKDKLLNGAKAQAPPAERLALSRHFGQKLKLESQKLTDLSKRVESLKADKLQCAQVLRRETQKLDNLSSKINQKRRQALNLNESREFEGQLEIMASKKKLTQKQVGGLEKELKDKQLEQTFLKQKSSSLEDRAAGAKHEPRLQIDAPSQSFTGQIAQPEIRGELEQSCGGQSDSNRGNLGAYSHFEFSSGNSYSESSRQALSHITSQIEGLSSWESFQGSGVSFKFTNESGQRFSIEIRGNSKNDLSVIISPEKELDRRQLWNEREKIGQALKAAGLSVKAILIKGQSVSGSLYGV